MVEEIIGFKDSGKVRSLSLDSLLLALFTAKIKVVSCVVTKYKPQYGSVGELQYNYASAAVIIYEAKSNTDTEKVNELIKLMA